MSRRTPPVSCLVVLVPALALASDAEPARRPMTAEDLWAMGKCQVQTVPGKGWNMRFRLYGPLEPWFEKTWRPGDPEVVQ